MPPTDQEDVTYTQTHIHAMEEYSAIKRMKTLSFLTTWTDSEAMLS